VENGLNLATFLSTRTSPENLVEILAAFCIIAFGRKEGKKFENALSYVLKFVYIFRAANYCRTSDNVRLNLANVRAKVILIGHWSDHKKIVTLYIFLL
jgi:hypothetical protein